MSANDGTMNIFTTDHPMQGEPVRLSRKAKRRLVFLLLAYPAYLLLLGPFWALENHHLLDSVPERVRLICYAPTRPIWFVPHLRGRYADYLEWWYCDPDAPDRETGWD
jgi:hypothetical protein